MAQLLDLLAAAGDTPEQTILVAIETPRGLLVAALQATSRLGYAINPMAVTRYRDRHTVSRSKSDHARPKLRCLTGVAVMEAFLASGGDTGS